MQEHEAFHTTHWSMVLRAGREVSAADAGGALEQLCRSYWWPVYAWVRREGVHEQDAEDVTQSFFADLLKRGSLAEVAPERGRFRSFLLAAARHFLANEWKHRRRQKRGGGVAVFSIDAAAAEDRWRFEPRDDGPPDAWFDRQWAATLVETCAGRLREDFAEAGRADVFAALEPCLMNAGDDAEGYDAFAAQLGMTRAAVASQIHRLRRRFASLLREEVARTVDDESAIEAELRHLLAAAG